MTIGATRAGRATTAGAVTTALGVALLVWLVARIGLDPILDGARQVGWGFALVLAISAIRLIARAFAWGRCLAAPHRLALGDAFAASLCAEAVGSLTPLGLIASEPARAAYVAMPGGADARGGSRVPLGAALAAVAAENFFYSLSAAVMIAVGMIALLASFSLPADLRRAGALSLAAMLLLVAGMAGALWLAARRVPLLASMAARLLGPARADRVRAIERRAHLALDLGRGRLAAIAAGESLFHIAGVAEVHVTLWLLLGSPPPLLTSFVLEAVNRVINVLFRFVPLRVGVDEAGTALFTRIVGLGATAGVMLALVRKARVLVWSALGTMLLVRRGLTLRRILDDPVLRAAIARQE